MPRYAQIWPVLSHDGNFVAYIFYDSVFLNILDRRSSGFISIDLRPWFPDTVRLNAIRSVQWCPYSSARILVSTAATIRHTTANSRYEFRAYVADLTDSTLLPLTPEDAMVVDPQRGFSATWLPWSRPGRDEFRIAMPGPVSRGYSLTSNAAIETPIPIDFNSLSADGSVYVHATRVQYSPARFEIAVNGAPLCTTPDGFEYWGAEISPDDRWLTVALRQPETLSCLIDLYDLGAVDPSRRARRIDLKTSFCSYALHGIYHCFVSADEMAVSMHRDGDEWQRFFRVGVDGTLRGPLEPMP